MSDPSPVTADVQAAKNQFVAHLRHELRTPLNAIIGYSEMALEDAADVAASDFVSGMQKIRTGGKTLLDLVNDILDAGKVAATSFEARAPKLCDRMREPLDIVLNSAQDLITNVETLKGKDYLDDLGKIRDAAIRLKGQVADILTRCSPDVGTLETHIPEHQLAPGMRDHVEFMQPVQKSPGRRPDTESGQLLVVDDNDMNRDVLSRRLQREGHKVVTVASGREALDVVRRQPFDAILLDILMPEMSGIQVLQHLKADPETRHIPVVMISALDEMESVIRSIETGAEDYLPKPYEPALLRARVGACLEKKRLRDRENEHLRLIEAERERADKLLHVILPAQIVQELKSTNEVKPRRFDNVAILFSDIVGFTPYCDKRQPEEVVANLQELVVAFEEYAFEHKLLKIKTIGDAFMAACGLLDPVDNPVLNMVQCGVKMIAKAKNLPAAWDVRIGIHIGPVVAGVLGHRQYLFDLWGDTVNTAARMESHGVPGAITLSEHAWKWIADSTSCDCLGVVHVKGKGDLSMYQFREFL